MIAGRFVVGELLDDGRINPSKVSDERTMLEEWLDFHRATLALKCAWLDAESLRRRSVPPSNLSLMGLLRHMTEVERHWFRRVIAREDAPPIYYTEEDPDGDFDNVADADPTEALINWQQECDRARRIAADAPSLDVTGRRGDDDVSLRWVMVHMIEEYARHNGHADLLRECIDGSVGD
jgi:uncharacterized damage-inducible protein DinB